MIVVCYYVSDVVIMFFFKQKTAYEMRISDWSSDVCSSDLSARTPSTSNGCAPRHWPSATSPSSSTTYLGPRSPAATSPRASNEPPARPPATPTIRPTGRGSCRERVCQYVEISAGVVAITKQLLLNKIKTTDTTDMQ